MLTSTKEVRTENTYESTTGYLASTSHNTTNAGGNVVYNFDYDGLGRQTGVSVGSAVLSETSYHPQLGTVQDVIYGNGKSVHYQYDSFGRVTGVRYDNSTGNRFSYSYNAEQQVAYVTDHTRNVTVYTDYDPAGRPCMKTHLAGTAHAYTGKLTYNDYELPNDFTEYVGMARTKYTTGFGYDNENRVTALTYGTGSVAYTYDKLGRITK